MNSSRVNRRRIRVNFRQVVLCANRMTPKDTVVASNCSFHAFNSENYFMRAFCGHVPFKTRPVIRLNCGERMSNVGDVVAIQASCCANSYSVPICVFIEVRGIRRRVRLVRIRFVARYVVVRVLAFDFARSKNQPTNLRCVVRVAVPIRYMRR